MEQKAGVQIGRKAFIQSFIILLILIILAGILTRIVPAGSYTRIMSGDREIIDPTTYRLTSQAPLPIWRWFTAPLEVLVGPDSLTIIVIIVFILLVGVAFALLDKSGILRTAVGLLVRRFEKRKYSLLLIIAFFFMLLGAFFGLLEEIVPLIPVMIALSFLLGWDSLVGLGMSILATNLGFSAAMTNPFTIGLAQKIAGLPLLSGLWLRVPIFLVIYVIFAIFLTAYARHVDRSPHSSLVAEEDSRSREHYQKINLQEMETIDRRMKAAMLWFVIWLVFILTVFLLVPLIPALSAISLPLVGLLFFVAGVGAGLISGMRPRALFRAALEGALGIAPGIPLILMAASVKYIVAAGGILDTILHTAAQYFSGEGTFLAAVMVYALALIMEVFVGSASAKVFLMMPILFPLGDLVGLTRQTIVLAYCFGDGFANTIYPTNPILLISLGLAGIPYAKWLRWSLKLWAAVLVVTLIFLGIAVAIHYGPF